MNSSNKIAIVVQGQSLYVKEVKNAWKDYKNDLIFSTWIGDENKYNENDIVLFNEVPTHSGPYNFNYQKTSTYNGLLKAKELGYTHALKIRSDYLPTNAKEFLKLLNPNKLNFLLWHYTSFLWLDYPTLNGYIDDHFSFGPIDYMIDMWNIKDVFCQSPEIMITWSYISKLKDKIDVNYLLLNLNEKNDLFYIKFGNQTHHAFGHNIINSDFGDRELYGRYESIFQIKPEYRKTPDETKKFMNDKYLNFLKYYTKLPKITIIDKNNKDFKNLIYPKEKLKIISDGEITTEYIIDSEYITSNETLIVEYFKKMEIIYTTTNTNSSYLGNFDGCRLLTKKEFMEK